MIYDLAGINSQTAYDTTSSSEGPIDDMMTDELSEPTMGNFTGINSTFAEQIYNPAVTYEVYM